MNDVDEKDTGLPGTFDSHIPVVGGLVRDVFWSEKIHSLEQSQVSTLAPQSTSFTCCGSETQKEKVSSKAKREVAHRPGEKIL